MTDIIKQELMEVINQGNATFFIGTGVSVGATYNTANGQYASWVGLIKNGIDYVVAKRIRDDVWKQQQLEDLAQNEAESYIAVATEVETALKSRNEYADWLRQSVGSLKAEHTNVLNELVQLTQNNRVMTTNYDDLLENTLGWPTVDWTDPKAFQRAMLGLDDAVMHLHGHWQNPNSVVFGQTSYDDVASDAHTQFLFRNIIQSRSLVFVGCGETLFDYNVGRALKDAIDEADILNLTHYWLVLNKELDALQQRLDNEFGKNHRIRILPYGNKHSELGPFLAGCRVGNIIIAVGHGINKAVDVYNELQQKVRDGSKALKTLKDEFNEDMQDDWTRLANKLGVTKRQKRNWDKGNEAAEIWDWLAERKRLHELPELLDEIERTTWAEKLRKHPLFKTFCQMEFKEIQTENFSQVSLPHPTS